MDSEQVSKAVDRWVQEDALHEAGLVVIRKNNPWYGMSEEEIEDRREFIRCYLLKEFELVLMLPVQPRENDFWFLDHDEFKQSAFNTWDYQRTQRPFDKYGYRIKKIMEHVKDLAVLHSCISQAEGRENIKARFELLVKTEFTMPLLTTIEKYDLTSDEERMLELKRKISKLGRHLLECKAIWEKYSPWEDETSSPTSK